MRKTSVYLTDDEAEGLRRASERTGRSQSELIREGVQHVLLDAAITRRRFHSMGKGRGDGSAYMPWNENELYDTVMGQK